MDYEQARAFIREIGKYGSVYGLDSIRALMAQLGDVQEQVSVIHVAGTNGKGSVCAYLSRILMEAGYRTGAYFSPGVFSYEEIFKVDGASIPKDVFAEIATDVREACERVCRQGLPHPTAFEVETAVAFCFFKREKCKFAVVEAGMGGAEDATNLVSHPFCTVLTSISRDHMDSLGSSLAEIAAHKAGIIKPGCPCVTAEQEPEALAVIQKTAKDKGSRLFVADSRFVCDYTYGRQGSRFVWTDGNGEPYPYTSAMSGAFQKGNISCVLTAVSLLRDMGLAISMQALSEGIAKAYLPGRFERIAEKPDFYIDGGHNEGAASFLAETVKNCFTNRRIVYIIGVFADKEYAKLVKPLLKYASRIFTITPDSPRALDGRVLADYLQSEQADASFVPDIGAAAGLAVREAGAEGAVLAFGSFSFLGELRQAVRDRVWQNME